MDLLSRVDQIRQKISDVNVSLETAVDLSNELSYVAMHAAFRIRAARLRALHTPEADEEMQLVREVLIDKSFQLLRKRDTKDVDYEFMMWPNRKDRWDILRDAKKRYRDYVSVVGHVMKHAPLPNDMLQKILVETYK